MKELSWILETFEMDYKKSIIYENKYSENSYGLTDVKRLWGGNECDILRRDEA